MNKFINKILDYILNKIRAIKERVKSYNKSRNPNYIKCKRCSKYYNHKDRIYIKAVEQITKKIIGSYSDCPICKKINYKEN